MATVVKSFAIQGVDGYTVDIESKVLDGQPMISIIGMGDVAVKEAGDRIQSAIDESGYVFPKKRVIISLAPGDKKKRGSHFDLAMAIGVLQEGENIAAKELNQYGFIGELSLDGSLRACCGILPMILAAKKNGIKKVIIPQANIGEAKLVHGIETLGFTDLTEVIRYLEGKQAFLEKPEIIAEDSLFAERTLDFSDVKGQEDVIEAALLAAAGGHNMLMIGEPGCGKTMIAQRISTILPEMSEEECLEVTKIYSISGLLSNGHSLVKKGEPVGTGVVAVLLCHGMNYCPLGLWSRVKQLIRIFSGLKKFSAEGRYFISMMSIETIIQEMTDICQKQGVEHLILFGSFATNTSLERSDIDFAVKGCKDILKLEDAVEKIETLRKIDVVDYDTVRNQYLKEDIER